MVGQIEPITHLKPEGSCLFESASRRVCFVSAIVHQLLINYFSFEESHCNKDNPIVMCAIAMVGWKRQSTFQYVSFKRHAATDMREAYEVGKETCF